MKSSHRVKLVTEEVETRLRSARIKVLIQVLGARPAASLAEAADAAVALGFNDFTLGALLRPLWDGEDAVTLAVFDLASNERRLVSTALSYSHENGGALQGAAAELGISLAGLRAQMRRHRLQADGSPAPESSR